MRTTININDAILEELRRRASDEGRPFRQVMEETLQYGLAVQPQPATQKSIPCHPVGCRTPYPGLSYNQLYDQLEAESQLKRD